MKLRSWLTTSLALAALALPAAPQKTATAPAGVDACADEALRKFGGDTVDEIVTYADNRDVDAIVVGSRGQNALSAALLGSVSKGVLREAKRPVVVVRAGALVHPHEPAATAAEVAR